MTKLPVPEEFSLDSINAVDNALGNAAPQRTYEQIRDGTMTRPIKCGRSSRWPRHEHQAIAAARISGASDDELRALVDQLHELRKRLRPIISGAAA